jgi:hypothetical protein
VRAQLDIYVCITSDTRRVNLVTNPVINHVGKRLHLDGPIGGNLN